MRQCKKYVELSEGSLDKAAEAAVNGLYDVADQHMQRAAIYATLALVAKRDHVRIGM